MSDAITTFPFPTYRPSQTIQGDVKPNAQVSVAGVLAEPFRPGQFAVTIMNKNAVDGEMLYVLLLGKDENGDDVPARDATATDCSRQVPPGGTTYVEPTQHMGRISLGGTGVNAQVSLEAPSE